jgi:transposase
MARPTHITITESLTDLKKAQHGLSVSKQKRLQMLILIKKGTHTTVEDLSHALDVSPSTVQTWRTNYKSGGIAVLSAEKRRGNKKPQITADAHQQLEQRLSSPSGAFRSFGEAQEWINKEFGLAMEYHAVNKYLKRRFGVKLKVARKSHIDKDPAAAAFFKKPVSRA